MKNDKLKDKISMKKQRYFTIFAVVLLFAVALFASREQFGPTAGQEVVVTDCAKCVVLDAGHGGIDPGKIGVNNALEKDINLRITLLVKEYLEAQDVQVIMTRETAEGLYDENASNKKVQDMKRRIEIIEQAKPDLTVSIHQNSYPEEYVKGAQVFYYTGSAEGEEIARLLQGSMVERLDPENHRRVKANDSYYLLKKTSTPIAIVECGFLSNWEEAEKLCDARYQEKVAWAIHIGILQYLNTED